MPRQLKKPFDWKLLGQLCQHMLKLNDCVEIMGVSERTIERYIRKEHNMTFDAFRDKKMAFTKLTVMQRTLKLLESNNPAICIFLLKNLFGMSDKVEPQDVKNFNFTIEKLDGSKQVLKVE